MARPGPLPAHRRIRRRYKQLLQLNVQLSYAIGGSISLPIMYSQLGIALPLAPWTSLPWEIRFSIWGGGGGGGSIEPPKTWGGLGQGLGTGGG